MPPQCILIIDIHYEYFRVFIHFIYVLLGIISIRKCIVLLYSSVCGPNPFCTICFWIEFEQKGKNSAQ